MLVSTEPALHASDQLLSQQTQWELWARWDSWQRQQEIHQLVHRVPPHQRLRRGQVLGRRLCTWVVYPNTHKHRYMQDVGYDNRYTTYANNTCIHSVSIIRLCILAYTHVLTTNLQQACTQNTSGPVKGWYDLLWASELCLNSGRAWWKHNSWRVSSAYLALLPSHPNTFPLFVFFYRCLYGWFFYLLKVIHSFYLHHIILLFALLSFFYYSLSYSFIPIS